MIGRDGQNTLSVIVCVCVCVCLKEREFLQTGAYACFLPVGVSDYSLKNIDIFLINA